MKKLGKKIGIATAVAVVLATSTTMSAEAVDSRTGSRYCNANYSVGMSTKTTARGSHRHTYLSDTGYTKSFSNNFTGEMSSNSHYRGVAKWTAETNGFFASVSVSCVSNPL